MVKFLKLENHGQVLFGGNFLICITIFLRRRKTNIFPRESPFFFFPIRAKQIFDSCSHLKEESSKVYTASKDLETWEQTIIMNI